MRSEQWIGFRVANWRDIAGLTQQELQILNGQVCPLWFGVSA
ncbi:hypothetical protein [Micromonospora sp. WMMD980]|nr:hypothetical protein [Micromonospora sp. WMMD980]MDG4799510.1 hypothetical protein [Micromonospora sp. WMMD980]